MTAYRSVSQLKQYGECPYQYYLARVAKAWERPAAWFPQGSAVHKAAEVWEQSNRRMATIDVLGAYADSFVEETEKYTEKTPNFDYWYASGPYKGAEDLARRYDIGRRQTVSYVDYYQRVAPDEVIWITPEGEPAIELPFVVDLEGVPVRGYIDAVVVRDGKPHVRDNKTGHKPGDETQLKVYAEAIERQYGVHVSSGDYWMAELTGSKKRKAGPTDSYDLDTVASEDIVTAFADMDASVKAGEFPPRPEKNRCFFCSVSTSCQFAQY